MQVILRHGIPGFPNHLIDDFPKRQRVPLRKQSQDCFQPVEFIALGRRLQHIGKALHIQIVFVQWIDLNTLKIHRQISLNCRLIFPVPSPPLSLFNHARSGVREAESAITLQSECSNINMLRAGLSAWKALPAAQRNLPVPAAMPAAGHKCNKKEPVATCRRSLSCSFSLFHSA